MAEVITEFVNLKKRQKKKISFIENSSHFLLGGGKKSKSIKYFISYVKTEEKKCLYRKKERKKNL